MYPAESACATGRRVLVVEDHRDNRESLRTLLRLWGFCVETAADGRQGVAKALVYRPQVAIIDIGLPGLDGYQVAEQVRTALGRQVKLIALTAYSHVEDRMRALEAGFDNFMTKPADLDRLHLWLDVSTGSYAGNAVSAHGQETEPQGP